ncbi:MAG TPA: prepilin-type N-terminal cleavage/methylation domain-containing protein [Vulgatibacter sp.]
MAELGRTGGEGRPAPRRTRVGGCPRLRRAADPGGADANRFEVAQGPARGFTLIEAMLVLTLVGLILGITTWTMGSLLAGNRVQAVARGLAMRIGQASSIAARTNQAVTMTFVNSGAGCVPFYEIRTSDGTVYDSVCISREYPGVELSAGTVTSDVQCAGESASLPNCSLCSGTKIVTFYPSGEVQTSGVNAAGDSLVVSTKSEKAGSRTLAVGLRNLNGRTRIYKPNANGSGWVCP